MRIKEITCSEDAFQWAREFGLFRVALSPLVILLLGSMFWTTWFITSSQDNTVIQRFGKYVRTEEPGPHGKLPWPIETATDVPVARVFRLEIGFRTKEDTDPPEYEHVKSEDEMLTGDENIAHVDFVCQYRRADAGKWLFAADDPEEITRLICETAMRSSVAGATFDEIATTGRTQRQDEAKRVAQVLVNQIGLGVEIMAIQLQDVHPPEAVMAAFKDVTNAKENQQQSIRNAEGYQKEQIPNARGASKKITEDALGYKVERVNLAAGDANRFLELLAKYEQAPELVTQRMRFEAIEATLPGKRQLIDRSGGNMLKFFNTNTVAAAAATTK